MGIDDSGNVVGRGFRDGNTFHPFLYTNGQMTDIGTLGGFQATAFAINDANQIAGSSLNSAEVQHAFLYQNGKMTDLGATVSTPPERLWERQYFGIKYTRSRRANTSASSCGAKAW
jgi:probable HAF family extracellular repeat protein